MACEDAEGDHDHDHDHDHGDCDSEAHFNGDGIRLESNGVEVYRQFQGAITGDLSLHVNESMDLTVHFLDQDANDIEGLDPECYTPTFVVNTADIIAVHYGEHDDHADEDGDHDHGEEEHCEDFMSESDCVVHAECEWHADEMACEDAGSDHDHGDEDGDDHDGHDHDGEDHGDEHDEHGHNEDANSFELVGLAVGSGIFNV